ncbi:MAG TPA: hypothetical protein VHA82_14305 [Ramlibacter sp.]|uniref:hypothetical protein n=1 Tax=Ramlibacter sp. TaxID=1917967 RepID=UPI002C608AC3|nr:hypothetical protein [Ramlibacter sp.]HVZ44980.1 hypothetical protein [Ramlibacter sp.]
MQRTSGSGQPVDAEGQADPADRQPPHVLGAWIHRTLVQAALPIDGRLRELQSRFEELAFECEVALLLQAVRAMAGALHEDDVGPDEASNGWRSRLAGRTRDHAAPVVARYQRVLACGEVVSQRAGEVGRVHATHLSQKRKILLEIGIEEQRLAEVLVRTERWLRQMWKGLTSSPVPSDGESVQKLRVLVERADRFGTELRRLQQAADAAQETCRLGQRVTVKREALLAMIDSDLAQARSRWQRQYGSFVAEREAAPSLAAESAGEAGAMHATQLLAHELDACSRAALDLEIEEQELGQHLGVVRRSGK